MSKRKQKYYVVWHGRQLGVFSEWNDCNAQITGYPSAKYKSFPTLEDARRAFEQGYERNYKTSGKPDYEDLNSRLLAQENRLFRDPTLYESKIELESVSVDASCLGVPGIMEYQGVETRTGRLLFSSKRFDLGTNNIGEFLAIVHALAWLRRQNSSLTIYSDSLTGIAWVKHKKAKTKLPRNETTQEVFELLDRAEGWLRENSYDNKILKWQTDKWGEIPADFGRK